MIDFPLGYEIDNAVIFIAPDGAVGGRWNVRTDGASITARLTELGVDAISRIVREGRSSVKTKISATGRCKRSKSVCRRASCCEGGLALSQLVRSRKNLGKGPADAKVFLHDAVMSLLFAESHHAIDRSDHEACDDHANDDNDN